MNYQVKKYQSEDKILWNDFVKASANGTFLHHRDYMDYHADRFADFSLMIYKDEKLVAVLPAHKIDDQLFSHNGLTYGNVLFLPNFRIAYKIDVYEKLLIYIDLQNISFLHIKSIPSFFTQQKDESLQYVYHKLQAELLQVKPFFVLETQQGIRLNKDRKKNLKKLQKLPFKISEDAKYLSEFWQIVNDNLAQKHQSKPVHSFEEIQKLMQDFSKEIKLFTLFLDNEMVSGALVFLINNSVHFQYIHSTTNKQNRQGVDFLINHILESYITDYQFISFGSSAKENNTLDSGLAYWKESFGAQISNQFIYRISVKNVNLINDILQ